MDCINGFTVEYRFQFSGKQPAWIVIEMENQIGCVPDMETEQINHIPVIVLQLLDRSGKRILVEDFRNVPVINLIRFNYFKLMTHGM